MKVISKWFKSFWKKHIIDEFPQSLPPECFDCNKGSCDDCEILRRYRYEHIDKFN